MSFLEPYKCFIEITVVRFWFFWWKIITKNVWLIGHVNGVNIIGLSLPEVPPPSLKPPLLHQSSIDFSTLQVNQLQPRRPTTGNVDFLLQPELLLGNL